MLLGVLQVVLRVLLENPGIHLVGLEKAQATTKEEQDLKKVLQRQKLIWQDLEQ